MGKGFFNNPQQQAKGPGPQTPAPLPAPAATPAPAPSGSALLVAIHQIVTSSGPVMAGDKFTVSESEAARLVSLGAAKLED